jgi:hypothetical protein
MSKVTAPKKTVISKDANKVIKASSVTGEVKKALEAKANIISKTAQNVLYALFLASPLQVFKSTGNVVTAADLSKDNGLQVFAETTEGIKVPLNRSHADMLNSLSKDKEIKVSYRFNELRVPAEGANEEQTKMYDNMLKYSLEHEGKRGFVVADSVAW